MCREELNQLRSAARQIFDSALRAVDARELTRQAITTDRQTLKICATELSKDSPTYAICIGKAANSMANALDEVLSTQIRAGLITSPAPPVRLSTKWSYIAGGHPLPNAESLSAAQATFELLERANGERANVIFAISGGGSAMMEWPSSPDISLEDLQHANRVLVSSGATIAEINIVRRGFSDVKGGKLGARALKAQIVTLIFSDTNRGDEANVASGPTLPSPESAMTAAQILDRFDLTTKLPKSILRAVLQTGACDFAQPHPTYVLADNFTAIEAAVVKASSLGFDPIVANDICEQPVDEGCEMLLQRVMAEPSPACLISGGEFACAVRGDGLGGRNSETVLRCALKFAPTTPNEHVVVLSAGTDGVDGNSPGAGAIADETTLTRARALSLEASEFLARSDSFTFFEKLDDAIITGPTGTNVRDLRIGLKTSSHK